MTTTAKVVLRRISFEQTREKNHSSSAINNSNRGAYGNIIHNDGSRCCYRKCFDGRAWLVSSGRFTRKIFSPPSIASPRIFGGVDHGSRKSRFSNADYINLPTSM